MPRESPFDCSRDEDPSTFSRQTATWTSLIPVQAKASVWEKARGGRGGREGAWSMLRHGGGVSLLIVSTRHNERVQRSE